MSIFGAMAKATHTDYQKFQYFFSDSKWDIQTIKRTRLEIIQKQRTTAPTKDRLLAIDDTGCPKPFAKKTEGSKWQYCGPLKRKEVCNVCVGTAFVSPSKHFPIDIIPYLPARSFPEEKTTLCSKTKYKSPWNSLIAAQKPLISLARSLTHGMRQHAFSRTFTRKVKSSTPK